MATVDHHGIENTRVIVVVVPFPVHSHSNQLLQLSVLISSYNIPVHYAGSAYHNSQVRARASQGLNFSEIIHFHDFPIPPFVPDPTKIPTEKFLLPYFHAVEQLRKPVADLLHDLSTKAERVIVIHDSISSSAVQDVPSIRNAESYIFHATTAFDILCYVSMEFGNKFVPIPKEAEIDNDPIEIPSIEGAFSYETANFIANQQQFMRFAGGDVYNGCRLIDGAFLDHLAKIQNNKKVWSFGPLHQYSTTEDGIRNSMNGRDKCLDWLDKQEPDSVLYISFGTIIHMADHDLQLKELAIGLELSETKFIWVFRSDAPADNKEEDEILPQGFEERVKGVGMVVRDWAPQLEILEHPSTGGFLSHCGWNSSLESISYGVPVAAWPMHSDQPMNALLITQVLKTGVNVKEWGRRDELVRSSEISIAVRRLMGSDEIRKRAKELGAKIRSATDDGGVSRLECDSFIAHITR